MSANPSCWWTRHGIELTLLIFCFLKSLHLLPGIVEKLITSNPCIRIPKKIFKLKKHKKMLPWQYMLPLIAKKLINQLWFLCNEHILAIWLIYVHRFWILITHKIGSSKTIQEKCCYSISCYQKVAKSLNHFSSSSLCKKYILKILVKISGWFFAYKEPTKLKLKTI